MLPPLITNYIWNHVSPYLLPDLSGIFIHIHNVSDVTVRIHNYIQTKLNQPTREQIILDLFLTTSSGLVNHVLVGPGICDHDTVLVDHSIRATFYKSSLWTIYKYNRTNWEKLHEELGNTISDYLDTNPDARSVTTNWMTLKCTTINIMEKYIPHMVSSSWNDLPYITSHIKHEIRWRQHAYNKAGNTTNPKTGLTSAESGMRWRTC